MTSVAVAGLLEFLLIHPLRDDPDEAWIRTYSRWLFVGLIPAAVMLLVAFWKRVLPYGMTELRLLGILLGVWLLLIAISYTVRQRAGIRLVPVTLAILLLVTLYGPLSVTRFSVGSQGSRLKQLVARAGQGGADDREASAALRFLLEHGARSQIASAMPGEHPPVDWTRVQENRNDLDSTAKRIMTVAGMRYMPEQSFSRSNNFYLSTRRGTATSLAGYDWMVPVDAHDREAIAGTDSVRVNYDSPGVPWVKVGDDTLVFDLRSLVHAVARDSTIVRHYVPAERLRLHSAAGRHRAMLALESVNGDWVGDSVRINGWSGMLFLGSGRVVGR